MEDQAAPENPTSRDDPSQPIGYVAQDSPASVPAPSVQDGATQEQPTGAPITWSASEFIAHQKTPGWYAALIGITVVLAVLVWLVTKDTISAVVALGAGLMMGVYASRTPRQITYTVSGSGVEIDGRTHTYSEFRSFSVQSDGAFSRIDLLPHKRFGLVSTLYYEPADEARILDMISARVAHEQRRPDMIEQLMRQIRF